MVLGRLIPRSGKGFIVRSLSVLFLGEGLLIAFFVYSDYVLPRLTRQFTSSPLTCEFFGDSHHQIPRMWWAVHVALWRATSNPQSASGLDDHSLESCYWRSFCALGRLLSHITPGQHFYYINFILSHKIITQWLEVTPISYLSFHGSGLWAQLSWALCSKSHKAVVKIHMGCIPFWNSRFSSKLMRLLAEFCFPVVVGLGVHVF